MRLLLFFSFLVSSIALNNSSHAESFGEWHTGTTDSGEKLLFAVTANDSGNLLGQYCSPSTGNCIWLIGMNASCKEGDQYPVLANSDKGSAHILVYCNAKLDSGLYSYVFTDFNIINDFIMKGSKIGFAVPLQTDQFRVVRFNLVGSNRAISAMRSTAEKIQRRSPTKVINTRDQDL